MIDGDAAFAHHFLKVPLADAIAAVPADAEQDDLGRKPAALEHRHRGEDPDPPSEPRPHRLGSRVYWMKFAGYVNRITKLEKKILQSNAFISRERVAQERAAYADSEIDSKAHFARGSRY
jgi:hypothetical protein